MNLRHGTAKLLPRPLKGIKASDEKTGVANTNILYHITMMYTRGKKHEMKNANTIMHIQIYLAPADEWKKDKQKYQWDNTNTTTYLWLI